MVVKSTDKTQACCCGLSLNLVPARGLLLPLFVLCWLSACAQLSTDTDTDTGSNRVWLVQGDTIAAPLSAAAVTVDQGREVFASRDTGHCVLCHHVSSLDVPFQGNVGPDLSTVGARLTAPQLRLRIVDASVLNPATVMPPYYRVENLHQVDSAYAGQPVLSALQVEQLVAYLASLRG